jgi:hypothetical protein
VNDPETNLAPFLAAWREDSLQTARPGPRERTRAALLAAVAAPSARRRLWPLSASGWRRRRVLFRAGPVVVLAAAVVIAAIGWNAPAGTALYGVRAARQGVQLAVPGADLASLHLQFAEQSLADARHGIAPLASLANARGELDAARSELPADHTSPLWTRFAGDQKTLSTEDAEFETENGGGDGGSQPPTAPLPTGGETPFSPESAPGGGEGSQVSGGSSASVGVAPPGEGEPSAGGNGSPPDD